MFAAAVWGLFGTGQGDGIDIAAYVCVRFEPWGLNVCCCRRRRKPQWSNFNTVAVIFAVNTNCALGSFPDANLDPA